MIYFLLHDWLNMCWVCLIHLNCIFFYLYFLRERNRSYLHTVCSGISHSSRHHTRRIDRGMCCHLPGHGIGTGHTHNPHVPHTQCHYCADMPPSESFHPFHRWSIHTFAPQIHYCSCRLDKNGSLTLHKVPNKVNENVLMILQRYEK